MGQDEAVKKAIACAAMLLVLAGCESGTTPSSSVQPQDQGITEVTHKLQNGRTVTCLLWDPDAGYDSGIDCDWANAR